jgi:hypothetical protein
MAAGAFIAVDLTTVKQRAFGTIMVIASIDALARYLDIDKENNVRLMWVALFALMFGVATVMLALADWIARRAANEKVSGGSGAGSEAPWQA